MSGDRTIFIFLGVLALVTLIILPNVFYPVEHFNPIRSLRKVIDYTQRLENLQQELTTLLKQDAFQNLIQNDIEPIENLITKESHEIQMYLREYTPNDLMIIKDFEESLEYVEKRLKIVPTEVEAAMKKKLRKKAELMKRKLQVEQDHKLFKANIDSLEMVGIYLNFEDTKGQTTKSDLTEEKETYSNKSALEILKKILRYFEVLEKLQDKMKIMGRHSSSIAVEGKGELSTLGDEKNKSEHELVETIYRARGLLRNVYPNSEILLNRIQEYFSVMEHKDDFWKNEWEERRDHLQKQYLAFSILLHDLKKNNHLRIGETKEL